MPDARSPNVVDTKPSERRDVTLQQQTEIINDKASTGKKRPSKAKKIENVAQLIEFVYGRKGKPVRLKPKAVKAITQNPTLDPSTFEELLRVAHGDLKLAVPVQLLLVVLDISHTALRNSLREFVGTVLREHPAFSSKEMNAALRNLPDGPDIEESLKLIASTDYLKRQPLPDKLRKKREFAGLRLNATYSLALWFAATRGLKPEELAEHLFASLWQPDGNQIRDELQQFRLLAANRDVEAVGAACKIFKGRADNMSTAAARARRGEVEALETAEKLTVSVDNLKEELSARDAKIATIENEMANQKREHENELSHMRDDHENLRARVLRRLKEDVTLLDEGVHALQRDPPKVRVMEDHAERALDGLRKEIQQLEGQE